MDLNKFFEPIRQNKIRHIILSAILIVLTYMWTGFAVCTFGGKCGSIFSFEGLRLFVFGLLIFFSPYCLIMAVVLFLKYKK